MYVDSMKVEHSKGPWQIGHNKWLVLATDKNIVSVIADCMPVSRRTATLKKCKANAKLIAAALVMLEVLLEVRDLLERMDCITKPIYKQISEVINQAT